ncbi:MAG: cytochrome c [Thermoanaerobaculia bacterium]|nr:cytochrome c [Thermoanaerobaculia bacterium]
MSKRFALLLVFALACGKREAPAVAAAAGSAGDAARGRELMTSYGCTGCHMVPGIDGPRATLGPALDNSATKTAILGKFPNTPENMIRWLQNPPGMDPNTTMPNVGVTEQDARDVTAFLFTLR